MTALDLTYTPRPQSLYGRVLALVDVEQALAARLQARLDLYLDELERQHGLAPGTLERPRAIVFDDRFPEDQLPAIVVRSPGTADLPEPDGQGRYRARFEVHATVYVAAGDGAHDLVTVYSAALRALALQQPSALFMGVDWIRERRIATELVGGRTIHGVDVELEVQVPEVVNRHEGPPDEAVGWPEPPPAAPTSPEWPVSQTADAELVKVPADQPVEGE